VSDAQGFGKHDEHELTRSPPVDQEAFHRVLTEPMCRVHREDTLVETVVSDDDDVVRENLARGEALVNADDDWTPDVNLVEQVPETTFEDVGGEPSRTSVVAKVPRRRSWTRVVVGGEATLDCVAAILQTPEAQNRAERCGTTVARVPLASQWDT
jgi:hypothetical protein